MLPQSTFGKIALTTATGVLAAGTAAGPALANQAVPDDGPYKGRVIAKTGLNVRTGPSTRFRVVDVLPFGTVVGIRCKVRGEVIDGNPRWYKLNDGRFVDGFSAARYITNIGPAPRWCHDKGRAKFKGQVIARSGLNVRSGPSTRFRIVDTIPFGTIVGIKCKVNGQVIDGNPRWYKLDDGRFVDGFSAARYIRNIGPAPTFCRR
ncbi:SH3 domain-containing protein [Streptomyces sp. JJ36]|uniref:SH3 domain-containing protein n=1 Tax=Streptomyces sp. JJ36 TaxID=2736645 RepID=UPI001F2D1D70|nr:SH3 domain-containing protein [Streptomyces sp. JJ36]MCF6524250.1 SH3 domain-containing protein [Streptomyces sp. JJ36]